MASCWLSASSSSPCASKTTGRLQRETRRFTLKSFLQKLMNQLYFCMFCLIRIVKMSSPNLNVLTLFGSFLTYSSGFLFAVDEGTHSQGGASTAVLQVSHSLLQPPIILLDKCWIVMQSCLLQARVWTLCVGSTLVFGPILGKTWRLYRVFTQRVPDKRVVSMLQCCIGFIFVFQLLQDASIIF